MATTTNYGWVTPDDTDLVKDGAAAIRTLGSSADTTTKNLNPETTLGDLSFRSSTSNVNTRIGIGSAGQNLTVVAGVPAWATPASGGMTVLATGTLSSTEVSLTGISGGFIDLILFINNPFVNTATPLNFRLNAVTTSTYRGGKLQSTGTTSGDGPRDSLDANGNTVGMPTTSSTDSAFIYIRNYTSTNSKFINLGYSNSTDTFFIVGFAPITAAITSIQIRGRNGTSTFSGGTYILYGVK